MKKARPLKVFYVTFSGPFVCVRIKAASAKEARTIAQDNYDRGELTTENAALRLLPEGRSIEAEFYQQGDNLPFIYHIEEE